MTKKYFATHCSLLVFAMIGISACGSSNSNGVGGQLNPDTSENSNQTGNDDGLPDDSTGSVQPFSVRVANYGNLDSSQAAKVDQAVQLLDEVMNSAEFKTRVENFTYSGTLQFVQNNGLTNAQIYDTLMAAAELYPSATQANGVADIQVKIYYPPWYSVTSAIAFTSTTDAYLNIYDSYFSSSSIPALAETLIHEWTHKLGFEHDYDSTARRPYSVPYGIGGIVYDLAKRVD